MATQPLHRPTELEAAIALILAAPRAALDRLVSLAIEQMDAMDGDPDLEDSDEDSGDAEDERLSARALAWADSLPGCPIADPSEAEGGWSLCEGGGL